MSNTNFNFFMALLGETCVSNCDRVASDFSNVASLGPHIDSVLCDAEQLGGRFNRSAQHLNSCLFFHLVIVSQFTKTVWRIYV